MLGYSARMEHAHHYLIDSEGMGTCKHCGFQKQHQVSFKGNPWQVQNNFAAHTKPVTYGKPETRMLSDEVSTFEW